MTIGIYCIHNTVNDKRYIGKSINIEQRLATHKSSLKKEKTKDVNRHLYHAVQKYGIDAFSFLILETCEEINDAILADLEIFYMDKFLSCDREHGYNLRRDSSTSSTVHDETRLLQSMANTGQGNPNFGNRWTPLMKATMSDVSKQRHADGFYGDEWRRKIGSSASAMWKDEEKKFKMARKVAEAKSSLRFYEYDKVTKQLLKVWESMDEIRTTHPDYHRIAIYSVCNGHRKSYRGSVWKSETKTTKDSNDLLGH